MKNLGKKIIAVVVSSMMLIQPIYAGTLINVSSVETKELMPDTAYVNAYISSEGNTAADSINSVNKSVDTLAKNLMKLDIGINHEDVVLQNIYTYENTVYNPTSGKITGSSYVTSATLTIKLKDIKNTSIVYDTVVKSKYLSNVSVSYGLENSEAVYDELLISATQKAINKAEVVAKNVYGDNATYKIVSVSENNSQYVTSPMAEGMAYREIASDNVISDTQVPKITSSATVYVTIDVE